MKYADYIQNITNLWFAEETKNYWFNSTSIFDEVIKTRYEDLYWKGKKGKFKNWVDNPTSCLAAILLFDQFPHHIFRNRPEAYEGEEDARFFANYALSREFERIMTADEKVFLFMPFMHSEDICHQELSIKLFSQKGMENQLPFALHHRELILRFGRFPHRNSILGRKNTSLEEDYLSKKQCFTGVGRPKINEGKE